MSLSDDVTCGHCGAVSAAGARLCLSCGSSLPEQADAADRPTETLPAVPPLGPAPPAPATQPRRRRKVLKLSYFAAGAGLGLLAVAGFVVVSQIGELLGGQPGRSPAAGTPAGAAGPAESETSAAPSSTCAAQAVAAPEEGAWRLAARRGDIQLTSEGNVTRLLLRASRGGSADDSARVNAELLGAAEAETRHALAPPGGAEAAIVVTFSPEFRMSGRSFELGRVGNVAGAFISSADDGLVAIIGVGGSGCFSLRAPAWEEGSAGRSADIVIDVER